MQTQVFKVTKIEPQKFRNGPKEQQMRIEDNSDSTSKKSDRVMMESFRANIVQNKVNAIKNEMDDKLLTSERYRQMRKYNPEPKTSARSENTRQQSKGKSALSLAEYIRQNEDKLIDKYYKELDVSYCDIPRQLRTGSKGDSIEEIRKMMKYQLYDHAKFNIFFASKFSQYLLEGIDNPDLESQGIVRMSQFIKVNNTYQKATIRTKNDVCAKPSGHSMLFTKQHEAQLNKQTDYKIHTFTPDYIKEFQKLHDQNTFCKSELKLIDFYFKNLESIRLPWQEWARIQQVARAELKKHTFITKNKQPTVEQLIKRIEETGPEEIVIDKAKEQKRNTIVMNAFQYLMMSMGLPWRDVTLENLNHKMLILDKLTKDDFRKFIVEVRPEFLDLVEGTQVTTTASKMKDRLSRRNMQKIDDEFEKAMKHSNSVIKQMHAKKQKGRERRVAEVSGAFSTAILPQSTLTSVPSPTKHQVLSTARIYSQQLREHKAPQQKQVFFQTQVPSKLNSPREVKEVTEPSSEFDTQQSNSVSDSGQVSKELSFLEAKRREPRVYKSPYADNIKTLEEAAKLMEIQDQYKPKVPQYGEITTMFKVDSFQKYIGGIKHKEKLEKLRKTFEKTKQSEQILKRGMTNDEVQEQLKKLKYLEEVEKNAYLFDQMNEAQKIQFKRKQTMIVRRQSKMIQQILSNEEKNSVKEEVQRAQKLEEKKKREQEEKELQKEKEKKEMAKQKKQDLSPEQKREMFKKQLSMKERNIEELKSNEAFKELQAKNFQKFRVLKPTTAASRATTGTGFSENHDQKTVMASQVKSSEMIAGSLGRRFSFNQNNEEVEPNSQSATFYRTNQIKLMSGSNNRRLQRPFTGSGTQQARIMSSTSRGQIKMTPTEQMLLNSMKFQNILHQNRLTQSRVQSAVTSGRFARNQIVNSFEPVTQSILKNNSRNSNQFAAKSNPQNNQKTANFIIERSKSNPRQRPEINCLSNTTPNRYDTKLIKYGVQSITKESDDSSSNRDSPCETIKYERNSQTSNSVLRKSDLQSIPKKRSSNLLLRKTSQNFLKTGDLKQPDFVQRMIQINDQIIKDCDNCSAIVTQDTLTKDALVPHDDLLQVIKKLKQTTEIASDKAYLSTYSEMLELIQKEKEDEKEQYSKEQIKKYKEDNHKLSLFLMRYEKGGETKIWKAEPIIINRGTELGKLLAAHE